MQREKNKKNSVYIDTDVFISAQLSQKGAAYWLLYKLDILKLSINSTTLEEYEKVSNRLQIKLNSSRLSIFKLINKSISIEAETYLNDLNDLHILEGSVVSKSQYLITYNKKDYKIDKIKSDFGILIMTPGEFLQFLRLKYNI